MKLEIAIPAIIAPASNEDNVDAIIPLCIFLNFGSWNPSVVPPILYDAKTAFIKKKPTAIIPATSEENPNTLNAMYARPPPIPPSAAPINPLMKHTVGMA